jgi:hypothetical protein
MLSAWKKIELPIITFMEEIRAKRLEEIRVNVVKNRRGLFRKYLESSILFASTPAVEASQLSPIRDLIENSPPDYEVIEASFEHFQRTIVAFSNAWAASKEPVLLQLIRQLSPVPFNVNSTNLTLATTFFRCAGFDEPIHAQDVFLHPSLFSRRLRFPGRTAQQRLFDDFKQEAWNSDNRLTFHESASMAARDIILSCVPRVDPDVATTAMMDLWNPLLECTSCYDAMHGRLIMTWRQAVCLAFDPSIRSHVDYI